MAKGGYIYPASEGHTNCAAGPKWEVAVYTRVSQSQHY